MISMQLMNTVEMVTLSRESHNFMACIPFLLKNRKSIFPYGKKIGNLFFFVFRIELVYKEFLGHFIIRIHTAYVTRIRNF